MFVIAGCGPLADAGDFGPALQGEKAALLTLLPYRGVNLTGAEWGIDAWGNGSIGAHGVNYVYPDPAFASGYVSADYFIGKGMNTFRLPFRWERLQPVLGGPFDAAERARLQTTVTNLTNKGAYVLVDPHNYARYWTGVIGETIPPQDFANFWWRLADYFKGNDRVIFGLMNEPHDMSTEDWVEAANAALGAIRNAGATNLVLVPGNAWTGAWTWEASWYGWPNAEAMLWINDPGFNYAIEVHQYMDAIGSGAPDCVSPTIGAERLSVFTSWLRAHGKRGFLGEFSGGADATCAAALDGMLSHLENNADVYLGWTYWAGGPWWHDVAALEPTAGIDSPSMNLLEPHLPAGTPPPQPLVCPKSYEAEIMYHSTGGGEPGGWNLWANGYVAAQHNFQQGTNTLMVSARGTPAGGVWPHMVVSVNGTVVAQATVTSSSYAQHWFRFTVPGGSAELRVAFDNDAIVGTEDRNLIVDSVAIHCGSTYEAENMYHQVGGPRPGAWNIWSNGYISTWHDFPGVTQAVSVLAAGEAANGWPHMVVTVGGVSIGAATIGSASYQPYTFYTSGAVTGEIRVIFDNDYYAPGVGDRNLLVDRVTVFRP
jgi:endoglucanase